MVISVSKSFDASIIALTFAYIVTIFPVFTKSKDHKANTVKILPISGSGAEYKLFPFNQRQSLSLYGGRCGKKI